MVRRSGSVRFATKRRGKAFSVSLAVRSARLAHTSAAASGSRGEDNHRRDAREEVER